jgi:transketolase
MPSWELFCQQPEEYRAHLLPPQVPKMAIEAGVTHGWHKFVGADGLVIGLDDFGASAPGDLAMEKFGFSVENVVARARQLLGR